MESLKIALVCDWFLPRVGGIESHIRDLYLELRELGHEPVVITNSSFQSRLDGFEILRIRARVVKRWDIVVDPRAKGQIEEFLSRGKFDLVHSHSYFSPLSALTCRIAVRKKLPSVLTAHSFIGPRPLSLLACEFLGGFFKGVSAGIAVSRALLEDLERLLDGSKCFVVNPGVRADFWRPPTRRERELSREKLGISSEFVLASSMRLTRRKNPLKLLDLAEYLRKDGYDFEMIIAGDGPLRRKLLEEALARDLLDCVRISGALTDRNLRDVLWSSDIFVHTSKLEAFGIAIAEAMSCSVPPVAMDALGNRDLVMSWINGVLAGSYEELFSGVRILLDDEKLRRRLGKRARVFVEDNLDWSVSARKIEKVYDFAIGVSTPAGGTHG